MNAIAAAVVGAGVAATVGGTVGVGVGVVGAVTGAAVTVVVTVFDEHVVVDADGAPQLGPLHDAVLVMVLPPVTEDRRVTE